MIVQELIEKLNEDLCKYRAFLTTGDLMDAEVRRLRIAKLVIAESTVIIAALRKYDGALNASEDNVPQQRGD